MSAGAEVLLKKKVYYENCPGCKQDLRNEEHPGIPYREFVYIWIVTICSALPLCSLYPFLYFMVRDLHIAKRAEDIGFYAGFVGAAFMFGRTLTSVFWGVVADRYGRKPVIMISIVSTIIFNTLFGLSTTFWMAVATRGLLGFFSGLLGPIKPQNQRALANGISVTGMSIFKAVALFDGFIFVSVVCSPSAGQTTFRPLVISSIWLLDECGVHRLICGLLFLVHSIVILSSLRFPRHFFSDCFNFLFSRPFFLDFPYTSLSSSKISYIGRPRTLWALTGIYAPCCQH